METAVEHRAETATLAFRISAFHERAKLIIQAAQDAVAKAMDAVETAMRNLRGPDPDVNPGDAGIIARLDRLERLILSRPPGNYGGVNGDGNWKAIAIVFGAVLTLLLLVLGWYSNTVIETRQDVAVIKCRLDPTCRVVVPNDNP
jgi:hypothetical protein